MVINEEEYDETVKDMVGMEGFISENNLKMNTIR